ncbi:MAG: serine--tRNA ligase [Nanobdellota archaeon]
MIDIQLVREQPDLVEENMKKKNQENKLHIIRELRDVDERWRSLKQQVDSLRHERNTLSKQINKVKKEMKTSPEKKDEFQELIAKAKSIPEQIKENEQHVDTLRNQLFELQQQIPNIMHESVPLGADDSENVERKRFGEPPTFDFPVKPHQEIATDLAGADFESSSETTGSGFYYLEGDVALLNQALIQYSIQRMVEEGFLYVETPLMVNENVISKVTDLHDREHMVYKIEDEDLYLIGTSEHSLIGRYINSFVDEQKLPLKQTSYSMCFRKEKGSHGLDERGLFRTHQFNKIEMVVICKPEESMEFFEKMKSITISIFRELELPIRDLAICSGDLGDLKHIQNDIEVWSPRREEYVEVGSCSNLTDAQSQQLGIRIKTPQGTYYPHTLNNTAIATSRALVAILENFQQEDGSVIVPKALRPYMGGTSILKPKK